MRGENNVLVNGISTPGHYTSRADRIKNATIVHDALCESVNSPAFFLKERISELGG